MAGFRLKKEESALLVIDVQEKLFPKIDRFEEVFESIAKVMTGFQIFQRPIVISEQYPEGLGSTLAPLKQLLREPHPIHHKTSFSCLGDEALRHYLLALPVRQWVVVGIEAHICVLQTVRDLLTEKKEVVVVNDAISSRSIYDFSSAIAEMRDCGARISSGETILFELLGGSTAPAFKQISQLVRSSPCGSRCGCC